MEQYEAGDYFNPWMPDDPFPSQSSLESLLENFVLVQTKQNEESRQQHQDSFGQRMQGDLFSNRYNSGWKNHPNFSYSSNWNPIEQSRIRPGFQQQKSNLESLVETFVLAQENNWNWGNHSDFFWDSQFEQNSAGSFPELQPSQKSDLETLMENFISSQTRLNEEFRQQNQEMCDAIVQLSAKVDSLATNNAMLEMHIAQQASNFDDQASIFDDEAEFDLSSATNHPSVESPYYETDILHQIIEEGTPVYHPENLLLDEGSFTSDQAADGIHVQRDSSTLPRAEIEKLKTHSRELRSGNSGPNRAKQVFSNGTVKTWNEEGGRSMANDGQLNQHLTGNSVGKAVPHALIRPFDPGGPKKGSS